MQRAGPTRVLRKEMQVTYLPNELSPREAIWGWGPVTGRVGWGELGPRDLDDTPKGQGVEERSNLGPQAANSLALSG